MTSPPCLRLGSSRAAALAPMLGFAILACSCDGGSPPPKPAPVIQAENPTKGTAKKGGKLRPGTQVPGGADYEDKPATRVRGR